MRTACLAIALVAACSEPSDPSTGAGPDAAAGTQTDSGAPRSCSRHVALYGMTGSAEPTPVGPLTVDPAGEAICVSLDARDNIQVAHFAAGTEYEQAASASFELTLFDADGNVLRDGWDVSFGASPTTAFANLEYGVEVGQVLEATLVVRAKAGTATTTVQLHLFEPYE